MDSRIQLAVEEIERGILMAGGKVDMTVIENSHWLRSGLGRYVICHPVLDDLVCTVLNRLPRSQSGWSLGLTTSEFLAQFSAGERDEAIRLLVEDSRAAAFAIRENFPEVGI
ncbi:MAG TPA: hypothetical protein DIW43_10445 [Spongiibacteraceae bacterium]|nr:hypothetical protein [Spongiibacteraceae bacterium]HCS27864.1 hypothetical protein [Spongiibacteraceae bacterium]|tara:strand:- start:3186 stop:3521 length:336 start_codon:yes stop_codon:yes gene_type:complete